MKQRNDIDKTNQQDLENTESRSEQGADYHNSAEIENPNPSTATPSIPAEVPVR